MIPTMGSMNPRDFPKDVATAARLPQWNPYAFAVFPAPKDGPWVEVFDVNHGVGSGEPIKVLITECDRDDWIVCNGRLVIADG